MAAIRPLRAAPTADRELQPDVPTAESGLGSLALEFLDTERPDREGSEDLLKTPQDLLTWLAEHSASTAVPSIPEARTLLEEARRLRADIRALVEGHHRGRIPEWALFGVNRVLEASAGGWRLSSGSDGPTLEGVPMSSHPLRLLGPIAFAAARLVATVPANRVRPCASSRCGAWFVDTSKGGRRRWCSMAVCGNREKAAAHRARSARG
jgi:predicted RNA-binding Zn ribbon-like protein